MDLHMLTGMLTSEEIKTAIRLKVGRLAAGTVDEHEIASVTIKPICKFQSEELDGIQFSISLKSTKTNKPKGTK